MDDSLKFTWAYMIQEGKLTEGTWNYYAGSFDGTYNDYRKVVAAMELVRSRIKETGIDWTKTSIPESNMESCFEGTETPASSVETLLGTLCLKDGSEYVIGVSNAEVRFSKYVSVLRDLMVDKQRVKDLLGE